MADHAWVHAANIDTTARLAALADLRGFVRLKEGTRIDVIETYCKACRRPWDDVVNEPCAAVTDNEHLRGGPIKERKNRTHTHDCIRFGCTGTGIPQSTLAATMAAMQ